MERLAHQACSPRCSAPMNRAKPNKRKSSRSREPAASRLEQAAGGERRAFLPAALCDALARRLAGGACNPRRSTPMNRKKPSKRKKQPVKRTGCKQAGTNGGRGSEGRSFPPVFYTLRQWVRRLAAWQGQGFRPARWVKPHLQRTLLYGRKQGMNTKLRRLPRASMRSVF